MDLKDRKRIINKSLPKYEDGLTPFQQRLLANGGSILPSTIGLIGNIVNTGSYDKSANDLNVQAGKSTSSTGGYDYTVQNMADSQREMEEVSAQNTSNTFGLMESGALTGAVLGSLAGPLGGVIGGGIGAIGGLVGGIFGGRSRRRKAEEALRRQQLMAMQQNEFNRARANTKRLSDKYAEENGFDATQYLNSGFANGKQPVYSPFGKVDAKADSKVSKGEVAIDTLTGSRFRIPTGPNDTALFAGGKNPHTAIITNKYGLSDIAMEDPDTAIALQGALKQNGMLGRNKQGYKCGKMPKYRIGLTPKTPPEIIPGLDYDFGNLNVHELTEDEVLQHMLRSKNKPVSVVPTVPQEQLKYKTPSLTVDVPAAKEQQTTAMSVPTPAFEYPSNSIYDDFSKKNVGAILNDQKKAGTSKIKTNKNKFDLDWLPNAISSGATSLAGLGLYLSAKGQSVYRPDTYIPNPNQGKAMNILASMRPNELPIINGLTDAQAKAMYALDNAGGMTGALKYLARTAMLRNTQKNIYDALFGLQGQYNQIRSQYANSLLSTGAQEAVNRMNANKYDIDTYMRGHAARQQGMQTGIQNMIAGLQQGIADADKLNRFNKMYSLYATA